jgi:hypothetical protein
MKGAVRRLFYWRGAGERDVPDAVSPLAVFLSDALRDHSDHGVGLVVCALFAAKADETRSREHGAGSMERNEG